jgi:hypothetical protein
MACCARGEGLCRTELNRALKRLLAGYFCLHAAFAGIRIAAPLLALYGGSDKTSVAC